MTLQSKYSIVRKIADGGTAEIFLAKQHGAQGFEKGVVLKRVFAEFYADPQFRHMLVDEAHIAMSLNHSNIVQVLDLGEEDGRYFLALELVDGWTLDAVLRRAKTAGTRFPPPLALYVVAEVCRALAYAHAKTREGNPLGIVHRDVSPHNVLVSEQGEVKLTDFGIAKAAIKREQSLDNMIKGKIAFMSPEQASGGEIDARSDLFSLGTMLYVMITRHYPFDAPTDFGTLMQVKSGDFLPPETARPGLNPELYRVIRKAMGKAPDDRYQRAEEMLIDVEQVMRLAFRPVGQTELMRWLAELAEKDGATPLTRQTSVNEDQPTPGAQPTVMSESSDSGLLYLADAELVAPPEYPMPPPFPDDGAPLAPAPEPITDRPRTHKVRLRFRGIALLATGVTVALVGLSAAVKSCGGISPSSMAPPSSTIAAARPRPPVAPSWEPAAASVPVADPQPIAAADPPAPPPAEPAVPAAAPRPEPPAANQPVATASAAKPKQVAVAIKSDPDGARVATRHHTYGTTPVSVMLRPGHRYVLTLTKAGYVPATTRYYVEPVDLQTVQIALKKTNEPEKAASATPPPAAPLPKGARANWWKVWR